MSKFAKITEYVDSKHVNREQKQGGADIYAALALQVSRARFRIALSSPVIFSLCATSPIPHLKSMGIPPNWRPYMSGGRGKHSDAHYIGGRGAQVLKCFVAYRRQRARASRM